MTSSNYSDRALREFLEEADDPQRRADFRSEPPHIPATAEEGMRWMDELCADLEKIYEPDPRELRRVPPEGEFLL